jgi:hypothetical protein
MQSELCLKDHTLQLIVQMNQTLFLRHLLQTRQTIRKSYTLPFGSLFISPQGLLHGLNSVYSLKDLTLHLIVQMNNTSYLIVERNQTLFSEAS